MFLILACSAQQQADQEQSIIYQSENLILIKLSENLYQHISFLETNSFGKVDCNGMIVLDNKEVIVLDTPTNIVSSIELLDFMEKQNWNVNAVVATHFHEDCIAGLDEFHKRKIPSYAYKMTIERLALQEKNVPQNGMDEEKTLQVGNKNVYLKYFGEGHTKDNIVAYFPDEKALFGGCLIKANGAGKGNLEDANVKSWSQTISNIKNQYPDLKWVIPGHGKTGGTELLEYTIELFKN